MAGLPAGASVELQNNAGDTLPVPADGAFTFPIAVSGAYDVTIARVPTLSSCVVSNGTGTAVADVSNVSIQCSTNPTVSTLVGDGTQASVDGTGTSASLNRPAGIAADASGNLYVTELAGGNVRKIAPDGTVTTVATGIASPAGIAVSASGDIYVASSQDNQILKITGAGVVSTFAGLPQVSLASPWGLAMDSQGNLYVCNSGTGSILKFAPDGTASTVGAGFTAPRGVAVGANGNLYVTDQTFKIYELTPAGTVTPFAGSGALASIDGMGSSAAFAFPLGIAIDADGFLYVTELASSNIRRVSPGGDVTTVAGTGMTGSMNGPANVATFNQPSAVLVDATGAVLVADALNHMVRKISSP